MKFFNITLLALVALCAAAPQQQPQFNFNNYLASQTTTTPAPIIHPPAKVHYVNIGQELNGDYKFGYDTGSGANGQSFREETRLADGSVKGQYGYLDAQNKMRLVKYTAGVNGFSIDSDTALNDEQIKASHYVPQAAQPQPQPQELPSVQRQPTYSPRQSFQGLASSASSPYAQAVQQPYSGYQNAYQSPYQNAYSNGYQNTPSQIPQYNPSSYGNSNMQTNAPQMTVEQLQQQAIANARARQAALSRQAQQEAIIINQQKAATQAILALQQKAGAPLPASQPALQPISQPAPQQALQQPQQPAPQAYQTPFNNYQPAQMQSYSPKQTTVTEQRPDVLSNFIQLPGVKLIQIDKPKKVKSAQPLGFGLDANAAKQEEENQGSVVINAALLSYNIGTNQAKATPSKKA